MECNSSAEVRVGYVGTDVLGIKCANFSRETCERTFPLILWNLLQRLCTIPVAIPFDSATALVSAIRSGDVETSLFPLQTLDPTPQDLADFHLLIIEAKEPLKMFLQKKTVKSVEQKVHEIMATHPLDDTTAGLQIGVIISSITFFLYGICEVLKTHAMHGSFGYRMLGSLKLLAPHSIILISMAYYTGRSLSQQILTEAENTMFSNSTEVLNALYAKTLAYATVDTTLSSTETYCHEDNNVTTCAFGNMFQICKLISVESAYVTVSPPSHVRESCRQYKCHLAEMDWPMGYWNALLFSKKSTLFPRFHAHILAVLFRESELRYERKISGWGFCKRESFVEEAQRHIVIIRVFYILLFGLSFSCIVLVLERLYRDIVTFNISISDARLIFENRRRTYVPSDTR